MITGKSKSPALKKTLRKLMAAPAGKTNLRAARSGNFSVRSAGREKLSEFISPMLAVPTPLEWREVRAGLDPLSFHIHNTQRRLDKKGDLFGRVLSETFNMAKSLKHLQGKNQII